MLREVEREAVRRVLPLDVGQRALQLAREDVVHLLVQVADLLLDRDVLREEETTKRNTNEYRAAVRVSQFGSAAMVFSEKRRQKSKTNEYIAPSWRGESSLLHSVMSYRWFQQRCLGFRKQDITTRSGEGHAGRRVVTSAKGTRGEGGSHQPRHALT